MIKRLVKSVAAFLGCRIIGDTRNETLREMLRLYDVLRLNPDDHLRWDHSLASLASSSHLRTLLQQKKPDLLIDVGANRGQFANAARLAGYSGRILSFEPQSALLDSLGDIAREDHAWTVVGCGIGECSTTAVLNVYEDDTFSSLLSLAPVAEETFGQLVSLNRTELVTVRTLDDILAELKLDTCKSIFLKSDTQGNELSVLRGAIETLKSTEVILVEATVEPLYLNASQFSEITDFLIPLGFKQAGLFPIGYKPLKHTLLELDCYYSR